MRCAFIGIVVLGIIAAAAGSVAAGPMPGDRLESFSLVNVDGKQVEWKPGRTSVLSFCAFWCDTWKEQSKRLARCQQSFGTQPVDFVTISVDGRWTERCEGKVVGTLLLDIKSALTQSLGIKRIPYTIVVDAGGVVRYASEGIMREAVVKDAIRACAAGDSVICAGAIYLTFDDFPYSAKAESTVPANGPDERLLDVLREKGAPATFFCICNRLEQSRDIVERASREGHSLQIHSWDHNSNDPGIEQCTYAIKALTGTTPTLYRPPGSEKCITIQDADTKALPVVNPYDYTRPGRDEIKRRILLAAKPGCVVQFHAGVSETIDALPEIIDSLRMRGFSFAALR